MIHDDRRKEAGKMLLDIAKYIVTVGLIGGMVTQSLSLFTAGTIIVVAFIVFLVGFYTIPPKKKEA